MRITTNMIYDRNLASMSKVSERQNTAYNQLMTGINSPVPGRTRPA